MRNKQDADKRERNGLVSHFLLGTEDVPETPIAATWVTVEPSARQVLHNHPNIQVYIIVEGGGLMHVGGETQQVSAGDLVYIPSNAGHGIDNNTNDPLVYVSAATPAFDLPDAYNQGQLTPDSYQKSKKND
ncbi:MAG: cupin domain-containing protein [Chloroflexi bacterium]|nr:cupin domain-containing protein [Chloroflexota bacterium]